MARVGRVYPSGLRKLHREIIPGMCFVVERTCSLYQATRPTIAKIDAPTRSLEYKYIGQLPWQQAGSFGVRRIIRDANGVPVRLERVEVPA